MSPKLTTAVLTLGLLTSLALYAETPATTTVPTSGKPGKHPGQLQRADTNGDGLIDPAEAQAAAEKRVAMLRKAADNQFAKADANKDGVLSPEEAAALDKAMAEKKGPLANTLKKYDKNGDHKIDDAEAAAAIETMKTDFAAQNARILARFDTNKDGKFSPEELAALRAAQEKRASKRGGGQMQARLPDAPASAPVETQETTP